MSKENSKLIVFVLTLISLMVMSIYFDPYTILILSLVTLWLAEYIFRITGLNKK